MIPDDLKKIYRTVWEIEQRSIVDMAAERGAFIDQSQSLNIHMDQPNFGKLTYVHFNTWSKGLKTGMYYLRSRAAKDAIKFTVDASSIKPAAAASVRQNCPKWCARLRTKMNACPAVLREDPYTITSLL